MTVPTGTPGAVGYTTESAGVCTVDPISGALTVTGVGDCVVTATAAATDDYELATAEFTVTVQSAGNLVLNVDTIAGEGTVNIAERTAGFAISGDTGGEAGVDVSVQIGSTTLTAASSDGGSGTATWSVQVPGNASYIAGTSVDVSVSASKTGYTAPGAVTSTLTVDLVSPTAPGYTAPSSLKVGEAIADMSPTGGVDVEVYDASGLPSGLGINGSTGAIAGTPDTADANPATATVTVTDAAGNPATAQIAFPAVDKGTQTLTGFAYASTSVAFGSAAPQVTAPTVTVPTGTPGAVGYTTESAGVCTVEPSTGALTITGVGDCVVTATAAGTDDYEAATADFTVTVQAIATLVLNLDTDIAVEGTVNLVEHQAGFAISGETGSVGEVDVTVTVGGTALAATSTVADPATWSVQVPGNAAYIAEPSVAVVAPTAPGYTAPFSLKVGEAIADMSPSGGVDVEVYDASGLPSGLGINGSTGAVAGTPDTAEANPATATVTVTDAAGNPATGADRVPGGGQGHADADRVRLRLDLGGVRLGRAAGDGPDGDGAEWHARGGGLHDRERGGVHGGAVHGGADDYGRRRLRGDGHGGGHGRLRGGDGGLHGDCAGHRHAGIEPRHRHRGRGDGEPRRAPSGLRDLG